MQKSNLTIRVFEKYSEFKQSLSSYHQLDTISGNRCACKVTGTKEIMSTYTNFYQICFFKENQHMILKDTSDNICNRF